LAREEEVQRRFPIAVLGGDGQGGTYVLRIRLGMPVRLRFGRFKRGKRIELPASEYVYVGSALAEKGSVSLARRLLRHATRSGRKRAHVIRAEMVTRFREMGLGGQNLAPPPEKKKRWNADFLLDLMAAEIVGVQIIRSPVRWETRLARLLEEDPETRVVEKGLGAGDDTGGTHLLRVEGGAEWWRGMERKIRREIAGVG
jgi:Uri superfamily endonuclease